MTVGNAVDEDGAELPDPLDVPDETVRFLNGPDQQQYFSQECIFGSNPKRSLLPEGSRSVHLNQS